MRLWFLPGSMVLLALLSLLTLKSVAPTLAGIQFLFFLVGAVIFIILSRLPYGVIRQWRWLGYGGLNLLLLIPLILGTTTRGIAGWIEIGGIFSIQPSQLAIPVVTLVLAELLNQPKSAFTWFHLAKMLAIMALPMALIVIEPDLGTTVIFTFTMATLLWVSQVPLKQLLTLAALGVVTIVIGVIFLLKPYQKARLTSFSDSTVDSSGANYNARQALIAVGSGQVWGQGLGRGVQSHLRFLPERQTDFIFASLAEELGFAGSSLVIVLYISLALFCLYIARRTQSKEGAFFCIAVGAVTLYQSTVNIGMNMSLVPITGITLPLLSYGGSSIVATSILFGITQSLSREVKPKSHLHLS